MKLSNLNNNAINAFAQIVQIDPTAQNPVNILPRDVFFKILSLLDFKERHKQTRVCKSWDLLIHLFSFETINWNIHSIATVFAKLTDTLKEKIRILKQTHTINTLITQDGAYRNKIISIKDKIKTLLEIDFFPLLGDAAISNKSTIKIREFLATLSPVYIQSSPLFKRFQNGLSVLENYYKSISIHSREEDKKFPPLFMINSTIVDFTEQLIQSNFSNTTLDLILDLPVKEHYLKIDQLISKCLANGNLQAAFTILQNEKISEDIYKNMSSPYLLLELAKKLGSLDFVEEKVKAMLKKYPDIALYLYCWENIKNKNYTIAYELQQKISNVFLAEKIASEIQNSLQKEHPDIQITRSNSNAWLKQLLLGINASVSSYVFKINCTERKWDDAIAGLPKLSNQKEGLAFLIKSTLSAGEMELAIQYFADHCIPAEYLAPISSIIEALCLVDQHSKAVETIDNLLHPKFQSTSYLDLAHSYITIHQYSKAAETLLKARLKSKHADYPQFINTRVFSLFDKIFGSLSNEKRFKELCIIFSSTKDLLNHYATNIATLLKDNPESEELKQVLGKIANKQVKRKLDQMNNPHKKRKH